MARKSKSVIHRAVRNCLVQCQQSDVPLTCLADFAEKLAETGWERETIHQVECGVLIALMGTSAERREQTWRWSVTG